MSAHQRMDTASIAPPVFCRAVHVPSEVHFFEDVRCAADVGDVADSACVRRCRVHSIFC